MHKKSSILFILFFNFILFSCGEKLDLNNLSGDNFNGQGEQNNTPEESGKNDTVVVPVPKISPAAGDYAEGFKTITITVDSNDSSIDIFYTTDGSEPDQTSNRYTEPFTILGSKTVRAIAFYKKTPSAISTANYNLNAGKTASQLGVIKGTFNLAENLSDEVKTKLASSKIYISSSDLPGIVREGKMGDSFYIDTLDTSKSYDFYFSNKAPGTPLGSRAAATVQTDSNGEPVIAIKIGVKPSDGAGTDLGKVTLKPTGTIVGKAFKYNETGDLETDHAGITVFIPGTSYAAYTDKDGNFSMSLVPQGMYTIRAMYAGYTFAEQENILLSTDNNDEPRAEIESEFALYYAKGTVRGSVLLSDRTSDFAGINIVLTDSANIHSYSAATTSSGSWTINDVTPGTYSIEFHKDGYVDQKVNDIIVSGARITEIPRIVLKEDGGAIFGKVLVGNSGIAGVSLIAERPADDIAGAFLSKTYYALSKDDGSYRFESVAPGLYTVTAIYPGYKSVNQSNVSVSIGDEIGLADLSISEKTTYTVTGSCVLAGMESGFEGTSVLLQSADNNIKKSTTTNTEGTYTIADIDAGSYILTFSRSGFITNSSVTVDVGTKSIAVVENVVLQSNAGTVTGTVTLESAESFEGIAILLTRENDGKNYSTVTDSAGHFAVAGVAPGTYRVQATKSGYNTGLSDPFTVSSGITSSPADQQLSISLRSLYGTVTLEGRTDFTGIRITATKTTSTTEIYSALSNKEGFYALSGMTPGEYILSYAYEGYRTPAAEYASLGDESSVTLDSIELERATGRISGIVNIQGTTDYSGILVTIVGTDYKYTTQADGTYSFTVPTGNYIGGVKFEKEGYQLTVKGETLIVLADRNNEITTATMYSSTGTVTGTVTLESAAQYDGIDIVIYAENNESVTSYSSVTDSEGHFAVSGMVPGTYRIQATKKGFTVGNSDPFILSTGETVTAPSLNLSISRRALYGTVTLEDKNDFTGVRITATKTTSTTEIYSALSNSEGSYVLSGMTPGQYILSYSYEGYRSYTSSSVSLSDDTELTLTSIELKKATGRISGIVNLEGCSDHSGITVTLVGTDYTYTTKADGTYSFTVPIGNYIGGVKFEKNGYQLVVKGETIIVLEDRNNEISKVTMHSGIGIVTGTVTLESAAQFDDIDIIIYSEDDESATSYTSVTDSEGHFVVYGVAPGTYRIQATKKGFTVVNSDPFIISAGTTVTSPSIKLSISRRALYGTIKLEGKTDCTGVRITATKTTDTTEIYSALSNRDGFYALSGMTPGEYILSFSYEGYRSYTSPSVSLNNNSSIDMEEIELVKATGKISGIVNLEGCTDHSGITVSLVGTDYTATTNADGSYEFTVPSGNYPGGVRFEKADYQLTAHAQTLTVLTDSTYGVPTVEMKATANTIKGVTTIAGAQNSNGIKISVDGLDSETYYAITDQNGNWVLEHIPLGYQTLRFSAINVPDVTSEVKVIANDYITVSSLEMIPDSATLKGFVFLDGMSDSSGITVTVSTYGKDDIVVRTTSDGAFTVNNILASGSHTVTFSKEGWNSQNLTINDFEPLEERTIGSSREYVLTDTTAPAWDSTPIIINNGANFANNTKFHVDLHSVEKGSGIDKMSIQITRTVDGVTSSLYPSSYNWQNYQVGFDFEIGDLPDQYVGNGTYKLYIALKDKRGNVSTTENKSITLTNLVTSLAGVLTGDKLHLTEENSPYLVEGDCLVSEGQTLVIDPGVEVRFAGGYSIKVNGGIEARGTVNKKILFTLDKLNKITMSGYGEYYDSNGILQYGEYIETVENDTSSYWRGIEVNGGSVTTENSYNYVSGNIIEYCEFEYATNPLIINSGLYMNRCKVHDCNDWMGDGAVKVGYPTIVINCEFYCSVAFGGVFVNNYVLGELRSNYDCRNASYCTFENGEGDVCGVGNIFNNFRINGGNIKNSTFSNCQIQAYDMEIINSSFIDCTVSTSRDYSSGSSINFTHNYWGETNTEELELKGERANISFITDNYDNFNLARIDYSEWVTEPFIYDSIGYSESGFVTFDFTVNGYDFDSGYYPENTDPSLYIDFKSQYSENPITQMRLAQSYEELKNASWQSYSPNTTFTVNKSKLINGLATIYIQVKDDNNNASSFIVHNIPYDTPVVSLSIEDGTIFGNNIKKHYVSGSATDLGDIIAYSLLLDGRKIQGDSFSWGTNVTPSYTLPLCYMAAGSHTLTMTATDSAGNTGEKTISFTINRSFNVSELEDVSYDTTTGQLLKDANTIHLWHLDNDGKENLGTAEITNYTHTNGGFEGSAYYLNTNIPLNISTNAFTVEFWTKGNGAIHLEQYNVFEVVNREGTNNMYHEYVNQEDIGRSYLYANSSNRRDDQWHYWTYIYDSTYSAIYCDGTCVSYQDGFTHTLNSNNNSLSISANGIIDELRISNCARSADEINSYYKTAKPILDANTGSLEAIVY